MKVSEITAENVIAFCRIDDPDEDEFVTPVLLSADEFEALLAEGKITDGKTVTAHAVAKAKKLI